MKIGIFNLDQYDPVMEDNHYTETRTPEGYITRTRIKDYNYDDIADRETIKPKDSWIKENKMTREEAIAKFVEASQWHEATAINFINALEALGLIKFEEKKSYVDIMKAYMIDWSDFEMELKKNGYKIVSK